MPREAVPACHPCYPGGSGLARAVVRATPTTAFPPPLTGSAPTTYYVMRLQLGSLRSATCGVAPSPSGRARQGTQCFRLRGGPVRAAPLPQATWVTLPISRAGLSPASLTVSTAFERTHNCALDHTARDLPMGDHVSMEGLDDRDLPCRMRSAIPCTGSYLTDVSVISTSRETPMFTESGAKSTTFVPSGAIELG